MRKFSVLLALAFLVALPGYADRRVSEQGRIRSVVAERDAFRVTLDRGDYSYRVPRTLVGRTELRTGTIVRLEGRFRGGTVWVDNVDFPRDLRERNDDVLTGRIERLNRFEQRLVLRDDRGRTIDVDLRSADERHRRIDIGDLHRGDRVTLRGRWERGMFYASRIENVSGR